MKAIQNKRGSLGKPTKQGTAPSQGIPSSYRGVKQGKFSGDAKYASNMKSEKAQMSGDVAWPNYRRVLRPMVK